MEEVEGNYWRKHFSKVATCTFADEDLSDLISVLEPFEGRAIEISDFLSGKMLVRNPSLGRRC